MAVTRFHILLREKINEEIGRRTVDLARGTVPDYAGYRFEAGYLAGLADSLKFCEDIEGEIDERSRPAPGH